MDSSSDFPSDLLERAAWTRALARRLVEDAAAADDLVQDAWLSVLSRGRRALSPAYLATVLKNAARERGRSDRARTRRERERGEPSPLPSTPELLEEIEQQRILVDAVEELDEPYRRTVLLVHWEGLSAAEIARREGIPAATVRVRHKRALDRLREVLDLRFDGDRRAWACAFLPLAAGAARDSSSLLTLVGVVTLKKLVLVSVALVVVALGVRSSLGSGEEPESAREVEAPAVADVTPDTLRTPEEPVLDPEERSPAQSERRPVSSVKSVLSGRVLTPTGAPPDADEELRVYAFASRTGYRRLVELLALDPAHPEIVARALVGEGGRFELELPASFEPSEEGGLFLIARGRHLYLSESVAVPLGPGETVLSTVCGAFVRGFVTGPGGVPARSIPISLEPAPVTLDADTTTPRVATSVRTAADGTFELFALPLASYTVMVAPTSLAPRLERLESLEPCRTTELALSLALGGEVRGHVVDEDGAPVTTGEIRALFRGEFFGFDDRPMRTTRLDESGGFTLEHVPPGELTLLASAPGFLESEKQEALVQDERTTDGVVIVLPRGLALSGRLALESGAPAPGVRVQANFDDGFRMGPSAFAALRGARGSTVTDDEGRFRMTGLGRGPFRLRARVDEGDLVAALDGVRGGTEGIELVLHAPFTVTGSVVDGTGEPVSGARVRGRRIAAGAIGEVATDELLASTDAAGAFALEAPTAGRWRIDARSAGLAPSAEVELDLPGSKTAGVLVLDAPADVAGVVLDPEGNTVSEAEVSLGRTTASAWMAQGESPPSVMTDARGRFHLGGLRAGDILLTARSEGFAISEAVPLTVQPGELASDVRITVRLGARLTGEVYGDDGRPAEGHMINLVRWQVGNFDARGTTTDSEGRFELLHIEPGGWQVVAMQQNADWSSGDGGESLNRMTANMRTAQVSLDDGEAEHVVLGLAAEEPVAVRGRVLRGREPYPNVIVTFARVEGVGGPALADVQDDGSYEVVVDGAGAYAVGLTRMLGGAGQISTVSLTHDVPDVLEHRLDLAYPTGVIAGRVTRSDGTPAAGARVSVFPDGDASIEQALAAPFAEAETDTLGEYRIEGLVGGSYRVLAGGARFAQDDTRHARVARSGIALEDGASLDSIDFELPRPAEVRITVVDAAGLPAGGATVFARDARGGLLEPVSAAVTDAAGHLVYAGLAPGAYSFVAASGPEVSAESGEVTTRPGAPPELTLRIEPAAMLWVHSRDANGDSIHAVVAVLDETGREVGARYAAANMVELQSVGAFGPERQRFGPLPIGRYRVVARAAGGLADERTVRLREPGEKTVRLRLED